jgi:hypothetical protein
MKEVEPQGKGTGTESRNRNTRREAGFSEKKAESGRVSLALGGITQETQ